MECIESRFQITTPTDIKICRGYLCLLHSNYAFWTVGDAGPYKENGNILMRRSLLIGVFLWTTNGRPYGMKSL
jgi:hypothetical protein